jgi:hypothetical protein
MRGSLVGEAVVRRAAAGFVFRHTGIEEQLPSALWLRMCCGITSSLGCRGIDQSGGQP